MKNIIMINMEYGIHDHVILNCDGSYTIFLNARDSYEQQLFGYIHALKHIKDHDFEKHDVQQIEFEAHRKEDENE